MATIKLGALAETIIGKSGNTVYYRAKGGTAFRDYAIPENPNTEPQQTARNAFRWAVATWNTLSPQQAQAWREFAQSQGVREPGTGAIRAPRARDVFTGLATKFLLVNPNAQIPLDPPSSHFFGDAIALSVSLETPGGVTFDASAPNHNGVVTELLMQRLRNGASSVQPDKFRTQGFVAFTLESLSAFVEAPPGWYACAYRFVSASTGQATALAVIGSVQVS